MALNVKWTKRADKKFDKILEYLLLEWGESVTKNFVKKAYDFLDVLSEFPEIGTVENVEKGISGFTLLKQINIFDRINGDTIVLLDFFDNRKIPSKKRF